MKITRVPIHADDEAALKKATSVWARAIQDRLKAIHGERFTVKWTDKWTLNHWATDRTLRSYHQDIDLAEAGRPYGRIVLFSRAELPRTLECALESCESPFTLGTRVMHWVSMLAMFAMFCVWAYYVFFGGGWARAVDRAAHGGLCSTCASKPEMMYIVFFGWNVIPILAGVPSYLLGEKLDRAVNDYRYRQAWRKLKNEFLPSLEETVREIEAQIEADPQVAQAFGTAAVTPLAADTSRS